MSTSATGENNDTTRSTISIPVCFEVKLLVTNPVSSIDFANELTRRSAPPSSNSDDTGPPFYRYTTYIGALNAPCRRGWRMLPAHHSTPTDRPPPPNRKFRAFRLLSPWIETDTALGTASRTLHRLLSPGDDVTACSRTGFRLHVSAGSLSHPATVQLCQNFVKYESALDELVPRSRRSGVGGDRCWFRSHRVALGEASNRGRNELLASCRSVDALMEFMNPGGGGDGGGNGGGGSGGVKGRSFKLNLRNLRPRDDNGDSNRPHTPSIEFRQHSSTTNSVKIRSWVGLCSALVTNSQTMRAPPKALKQCRSPDDEFNALFEFVVRDKPLSEYYRTRRAELAAEGGAVKVKRRRNRTRHDGTGASPVRNRAAATVPPGVECGCCFSSFPPGSLCTCTANVDHTFCRTCVRRYVEQELFTNQNTVMRCMSTEGCTPTSIIVERDLSAAVSKTVLQKLKEARREQKMRTETDARNTVEEAMSGALVRNCPTCSVASVIDSGCNKMTCPRCRTTWCYICKVVTDRSTSHWTGGACALYTSGDQTDRPAVRAAGESTTGNYSGTMEGRSLVGLVQKLI